MTDDYMDNLLIRKGFKELDDSLRLDIVKGFWERLKPSLQLEIQRWNEKCEGYDAASTRIAFYPNPFMMESMKELAELTQQEKLKEFLNAPDLGGAPMWSVCAETARRDLLERPKVRLYVWLTQTEPYQIKYSYGARFDSNSALEVPLTYQAGAIVFDSGESEEDFIRRSVRNLLLPLMEAA